MEPWAKEIAVYLNGKLAVNIPVYPQVSIQEVYQSLSEFLKKQGKDPDKYIVHVRLNPKDKSTYFTINNENINNMLDWLNIRDGQIFMIKV